MSSQSPTANGPGQIPDPPFERGRDTTPDETADVQEGVVQGDGDGDAVPPPPVPPD